MSLEPDVTATRQMIGRVIDSLSDDPQERATIAARAAFTFISLAHGDDMAIEAFARVAGLERTR